MSARPPTTLPAIVFCPKTTSCSGTLMLAPPPGMPHCTSAPSMRSSDSTAALSTAPLAVLITMSKCALRASSASAVVSQCAAGSLRDSGESSGDGVRPVTCFFWGGGGGANGRRVGGKEQR